MEAKTNSGGTVEATIKIGFGEKLHSATKIAAVIEALLEEGVSPAEALRGVHLQAGELHLPTTRISLNQMLEACRNAMKLSRNPHLAFDVGSSIHLSTYGMYGYAMLCSTDFRRTMEFAVRYHQLATPLTNIVFEEKGKYATWTIVPLAHPRIDAPLYQFVTELQIGIHISLMRDVMGASFAPTRIAVVCPGSETRLTQELVGCPVLVEEPTTQIVLDTAWLDKAPTLGNRVTHAAVLEICDGLLVDLGQRSGVAGRVREVLLENIANRADFETVAKRLRTTERTLRRQLRAQQTSFRELVDELRMQLAIKYLRDTDMTGEDIAVAVGFSDAANFRHAFRRWTRESPSEFKHLATDAKLPFDR
ncbi:MULTISPECIES: AraC family transcriptional regulator [unclassified Bradyrhizobium]|uniref:AraC family transcriptional regulator n=1 Tax=unclassified Bradyrhizobium TaxID=2631580 RepID=UPI0004904A3C|nr:MULTISPECIES: AraC family transcriptional regulator [unclassified Bradyrhizobium]QIG98273.1 AraC family transcriptional regulator [Bradyrhizobium sp. 6(2017)]